jgi:CheY-like chemotaxis protein
MTREKPLILVVEDEPLLRLNATDVLEEAGYLLPKRTMPKPPWSYWSSFSGFVKSAKV